MNIKTKLKMKEDIIDEYIAAGYTSQKKTRINMIKVFSITIIFFLFLETTVFAPSIETPYLLTILVQKFEIVPSTTC